MTITNEPRPHKAAEELRLGESRILLGGLLVLYLTGCAAGVAVLVWVHGDDDGLLGIYFAGGLTLTGALAAIETLTRFVRKPIRVTETGIAGRRAGGNRVAINWTDVRWTSMNQRLRVVRVQFQGPQFRGTAPPLYLSPPDAARLTTALQRAGIATHGTPA